MRPPLFAHPFLSLTSFLNRKTSGKLQALAHTRRAAAQSCDALTTLSHKPSPAPSPYTMLCVMFYLISVPSLSPISSLSFRFCCSQFELPLLPPIFKPDPQLSLSARVAPPHPADTPPPPRYPGGLGVLLLTPPPGEQMDTAAADAIVVLLQPLPYIYTHIVLLDKFLSEPLASPWLTSA